MCIKRNYKKNFLSDVIFEIKFPPIMELMGNDRSSGREFQKKIINEFPYGVPNEIHEFKVDMFGDPKRDINTRKRGFINWVFTQKESQKIIKKVELSYDKILLSYENNNYKSYREFQEDIKLIINAIKSYPIIKVEYVGLRYINQIILQEGNYTDWEGYIIKSLYNPSPNFTDKTNLQRFMHVMEFKEKDYNIHFQFGQFNSEYPAPLSRKEFVLDYTCRLEEDIDLVNVGGIVDEMHDIIGDLFEKSIDTKLREIMEES